MLVVIHRGMPAQGKEWIRKNYVTTCALIEEKTCESGVTLNKQETPQKAKYAEDYLNCESHSRKKEVKKNSWNIKNIMCVPK